MKKLILSIAILALTVGVKAQTNSITSGNNPTSEAKGYTFKFNGDAVANCTSQTPNEGSIKASWDAKSTSIDTSGFADGNLILSVDTTNGWGTSDAFVLIMTEDNCSMAPQDLSLSPTFKFNINATSAVSNFYVAFCDGSDNCADFSLFSTALEVGDNAIDYDGSTTDFKWETWDAKTVDSTDISYLLIGIREGAWGTAVTPGTYTIDDIQIGDATVVGTSNAIKNNSVAAFPNPATTRVNFETTLENVTIYNVVGLPVYETQAASSVDVSSFDSGVYFIQHAAGTTRFSVQ